jgi:hypothetical protein
MSKIPIILVLAGVMASVAAADVSVSVSVSAASPSPAKTQKIKPTPTPGPLAPAKLPGKGLAQHDFFYAGEAKTEDMYIIRNGRIVWSYHVPNGKPELSDAVLMSNGNVLFAHMGGVTEITPDKKVVWNYNAPPGSQIHTAQPIGRKRVLYIQNGPAPGVFVVNIVNGKTELHFPLEANTAKVHTQFRHARLTPAGTLLVAHMDMGVVREYDQKGRIVWSWKTPGHGPWSAERLANGNTLVVSTSGELWEVSPKGKIVWQFTQADAPAFKFWNTQRAVRLANGNTIFNNWFNQWAGGPPDPNDYPLQAIEVTPGKKVVWALRSWTPPAALGPATTIQILDDPTAVPEDAHFGDIR